MEFFAVPHFSDASLESGNNKTQLCPMCIFLIFLKPLLLTKALYLFKVVLLPCVYFAFPAVLGLFKKNNGDAG